MLHGVVVTMIGTRKDKSTYVDTVSLDSAQWMHLTALLSDEIGTMRGKVGHASKMAHSLIYAKKYNGLVELLVKMDASP